MRDQGLEVEGRMSRVIGQERESRSRRIILIQSFLSDVAGPNRLTIAYVFNQQLSTILCSLERYKKHTDN